MATLPADAPKLLWSKDSRLWSNGKYGSGATDFLGWLDVVATMETRVGELQSFVREALAAGFDRVILAGMGGSSLAPLVFENCVPPTGRGLRVDVLDSTDPATVLRMERIGPLEKALIVVSSKSGSTAEPNAFCDYFYAKLKELKGDSAGENFAAITDPGSPFQTRAEQLGFRKIFLNFPDIGGRYSALSYFGLVPAALQGSNISAILAAAIAVNKANGPDNTIASSPAISFGQEIGDHALAGRNKLTFVTPPELEVFGLWLEQLIAESTGKEGKGVLPIAGEKLGPPSVYGSDRVFVYVRPEGPQNESIGAGVEMLREAGHPVYEFLLDSPTSISGIMMAFELATAIIGAVIEINPFDQPNVQESKDITKAYVKQMEDEGALPPETPTLTEGDLAVYGGPGKSFSGALTDFLTACKPGDYICLQAYLTETPENSLALQELQRDLRDKYKVAVTNGYGPRFLHSTGQFHKGGPNTGLFIQLTQDDAEDVALPGKSYTFGAFRNAQARGDKEALLKHGRRVIRLHLGAQGCKAIEGLSMAVCED